MCIYYNYIKDCRQRGERGPVVDGAKYEVLILQQKT